MSMIKRKDLWQASYNFLGISVFISSDSPHFFAYMDSMYSNFRRKFSRNSNLTFQVFIESEEIPFIRINGVEKHFDPNIDPIAQASFAVWSAIVGSMNRFYLIHSAALSYKSRGIMVIGPAGYGKTSLALRLSNMGCHILSDSFSPICRSSGRVYPFPRNIGIREKTSSWYKVSNYLNLASVKSLKNSGKRLLSAEAMKDKFHEISSPVNYIFLLDSPLEEVTREALPFKYFDFAFFHKSQDAVREFTNIDGVHISKIYMDGPLYAYRIGIRGTEASHAQLERIWKKHMHNIAYKKSVNEVSLRTKPRFISEMPLNSLLVYFMMHFRNNPYKKDIYEPCEGNLSRMAADVRNMLGDAKSYRVERGGLNQVSQSIMDIVERK